MFNRNDIAGDLESLLAEHFKVLHSAGGRRPIAGGQSVADQALAELNISGYAKDRSEVLPFEARGA